MIPKPKNRGGRPRTHKIQQGDRVSISLRVTPETKARLEAAAQQSGRSISQEAELRLEQSFRDQDAMLSAMENAYGRSLAGLVALIGAVMHGTGPMAGALNLRADQTRAWSPGAWFDDPWARHMARDAATVVLHETLTIPVVPDEAEGPLGGEFDKNFGKGVAAHYLRALGFSELPEFFPTPDETPIGPDLQAWADRLRPLLARWLKRFEKAETQRRKGRAA